MPWYRCDTGSWSKYQQSACAQANKHASRHPPSGSSPPITRRTSERRRVQLLQHASQLEVVQLPSTLHTRSFQPSFMCSVSSPARSSLTTVISMEDASRTSHLVPSADRRVRPVFSRSAHPRDAVRRLATPTAGSAPPAPMINAARDPVGGVAAAGAAATVVAAASIAYLALCFSLRNATSDQRTRETPLIHIIGQNPPSISPNHYASNK